MRKFDFLEIVLALLTAIVILAIITTIMALAYPDVTASIVHDVRQRVDQGDSPLTAVGSKLGQRFADGFNYRVGPFIKQTAEKVRLTASEVRNGERKAEVKLSFKAEECLTCHQELFEERAIANLYVDHRIHESLEIGCAECHSDIEHPKPKTVGKKVCVDCHEARGMASACLSCHPPGSIGEVVSATKTAEFLKGRSLQAGSLIKGTFAVPDRAWLDHSSDTKAGQGGACAACHATQEFCNTCHLVFHNRLSGWNQTHGPKILSREYTLTGCWSCHSSYWCAAVCHAVPAGQRQRNFYSPPLVPLTRDSG
jgi:hypothetical protein